MDDRIILALRGVDITRIMHAVIIRATMITDPVEHAALIELYDNIKDQYKRGETYDRD